MYLGCMDRLLIERDTAERLKIDVEASSPARRERVPAVAEVWAGDVSSGVARIKIDGAITRKPSWWQAWLGVKATTYSAITEAVQAADADPRVEQIELRFDSAPGGTVAGMFECARAIAQTATPTKAVVSNMCASAAYGLASQCGRIVATNRGALIGSVGVAATVWAPSKVAVDVTSTGAEKKRPDVTTEEGKAIVREELDALHREFVEIIATGRGCLVEEVRCSFGQGAVLVAADALDAGMIDAIEEDASNTQVSAVNSGGERKAEQMETLEELRAQKPELYAAAIKAGEDKERQRVLAHFELGAVSGDTETTMAAIKDGADAGDGTVHAKHLAATLKATKVAAAAKLGNDLKADAAPEVSGGASDDDSAEAAALARVFGGAQ